MERVSFNEIRYIKSQIFNYFIFTRFDLMELYNQQ